MIEYKFYKKQPVKTYDALFDAIQQYNIIYSGITSIYDISHLCEFDDYEILNKKKKKRDFIFLNHVAKILIFLDYHATLEHVMLEHKVCDNMKKLGYVFELEEVKK